MSAAFLSTAEKPAVLAIFILTYLGISAGRVPGLKLDRTGIVLLGAIAVLVVERLPGTEMAGFISWPTILLLFGFFVISAQLRLSGFFDLVAGRIAGQLAHPARVLLLLMATTAGLSAFLNHDIVCFVFAPIVGAALLQRQLDPVPFLVALAIASNIGAAATLVGNPQDMMIGQIAGLGFGEYVLWCIWPVAFALGAAYAVIWLLSRKSLALTTKLRPRAVPPPRRFDRGHTIKGLVILGIVIGLFFSPLPKELVALTAAAIHLASRKFRTVDLLRLVDWPILVLFMGLFVVTGAFQATGYGQQAVQWLAHEGLNLSSPPVLALFTAGLSNIVSNAAAVMLLLKTANVAHPPAAYVLALANSFGGSLIIVGSVANIIVVQQARALGIDISFRAFARLGIPVTIVSLGGLICWLAVAP
jgi:Na+/H+ antiporter NhaD/arsenite permease-like protein